jgi:hypothetical protein
MERQRPTLIKLDRFFCNAEWDATFSNHVLNALSTSLSDHCPLLLYQTNRGLEDQTRSNLKIIGSKLPGFKEVVKRAWDTPITHHEPFHVLYHKLHYTSQKLKTWSKEIISDAKKLFFMAQEVILRLDFAQ